MSLQRWFYRGGRPNRAAKILNRAGAAVYARGISPNYLVTLEVPGRRSGLTVRLPLVMVVVGGERYLVSMLGEDANWVRNVMAAGGYATLRHGRREEVRLEEIAPEGRPPVLKAYLEHAPGARPHIPVDKDAPLAEFERVSSRFPVFRVLPKGGDLGESNEAFSVSGTEAWRSAAVFAVKLVHSAIFLGVATGVLHVFYAGITGRGSRWVGASLALALGESAIFAFNGFRCPLRKVAEDLGAESGQVTDIFLPRPIAERIPQIFTPPLIVGILALLWRRLLASNRTRQGRRDPKGSLP